jgi:hypothetical protein
MIAYRASPAQNRIRLRRGLTKKTYQSVHLQFGQGRASAKLIGVICGRQRPFLHISANRQGYLKAVLKIFTDMMLSTGYHVPLLILIKNYKKRLNVST